MVRCGMVVDRRTVRAIEYRDMMIYIDLFILIGVAIDWLLFVDLCGCQRFRQKI